jgi:hypothetical protein
LTTTAWPTARNIGRSTRVRVGIRALQIDAVALGDGRDRRRLALAVGHRAGELAGVGAVRIDLEAASDRAVEAQDGGDHLGRLCVAAVAM